MLGSSFRLFQQLSLCAILCTFLSTQAYATPLSLSQRSILEDVSVALASLKSSGRLDKRDVVAPPIIKPDANSVWPIGTVQEVTWDISDLPPDDQITNIRGQVILGHDTGDSLNLDLEHPLAKGFHIRQGRVNITVPNVLPRNDYLVVLMGNSGNTSPSFAITRIKAPGDSSSSSVKPDPGPSLPGISPTRSSVPPALSSTTITDPIPISGTTITGSWGTEILSYPASGSSSSTPVLSSASSESSTSSAENSNATDSNQEGDNAVQNNLNIGLLLAVVVTGFLALN